MDLWWVGILLSLGSTFAGAFGNIMIKQSHNVHEIAQLPSTPPPETSKLIRRSWIYWFLGAVVFTIMLNASLNLAAMAFAAASLLSPFSAVAIVWNSFLSPCWLGESFTRRDVYGTALIVLGCLMSGIFAPHSDEQYLLAELLALFREPAFLVYGCVAAVLLVLLFAGSRSSRVLVRRLSSSSLPGLIVGNTNILGKSASELIAGAIEHLDGTAFLQLQSWLITTGAIFLPLINLYFLSRALAEFDAVTVVPVYISAIITSSFVSGGIYFQELMHLQLVNAVGLVTGVLIVVGGVVVLSSVPQGQSELKLLLTATEEGRVFPVDPTEVEDTAGLYKGTQSPKKCSSSCAMEAEMAALNRRPSMTQFEPAMPATDGILDGSKSTASPYLPPDQN